MLRAVHARVHEKNSPKAHTIKHAESLLRIVSDNSYQLSSDWPPCSCDDKSDEYDMTLKDIGEVLGMGRQNVYRIYSTAMRNFVKSWYQLFGVQSWLDLFGGR